MNATMTNGRMRNDQHTPQPRKQLSDQIDRLDDLVDGLANELPKAVADATREGTRLAVKDVLKELLTDPVVLAQFRTIFIAPVTTIPTSPASTPVPTPVNPQPVAIETPSFFARLKASAKHTAETVKTSVKERFTKVKESAKAVKTDVNSAITSVRNILPLGRFLMIALAVGLMMAITSYVAPPEISAVLTGIGGAVVAMVLQVFRWVRRSARSLIFLR